MGILFVFYQQVVLTNSGRLWHRLNVFIFYEDFILEGREFHILERSFVDYSMLFDTSDGKKVFRIFVLVWYCICVFHLFLSILIRETMEAKGSCDSNT